MEGEYAVNRVTVVLLRKDAEMTARVIVRSGAKSD